MIRATEVFKDIPVMHAQGVVLGEVMDYDADTWVFPFEGIELQEYQTYLSELESAGFSKIVDNNKGLHGIFYNAILFYLL